MIFFRYTPFALKHLLNETGFQVEHSYERGGTFTVWCDITFRAFGVVINRLLKALRLPASLIAGVQALLITLPQWLVAQMILRLYRWLPRIARHIDPSDRYTLGYVVIAKKNDVRNRR